MEPIGEALQLLRRREQLESAIKSPSGPPRGIPTWEEGELYILRARLSRYPKAAKAVLETARSLNRGIRELSVTDVEHWLDAGCG
jgi:hypothetical protein